MPGSLNSSFIPKRNPNKKVHSNAPRPIFIGTLIIRILFFAILIITLGIFAYEKKLNNDRDAEVLALNNAIAEFKEDEIKKLLLIDNKFFQVKERLEHTVSMVAIFNALELATVDTVKIKNLELKRLDDNKITLDTEMETKTFDAILFQRNVFEKDKKLVVEKISDLTLNSPEKQLKQDTQDDTTSKNLSIAFKTELSIDTKTIPHLTVPINQTSSENEEILESEFVNEELLSNQENI